ncbi:uncharacterized protein LOC112041434 [Lingula anatina]|uniref:Uncharacterized protein LOC112041434 n=1 Tax=Lingula anatina TaxID=7574 RepID=A0A2R2MJM7_LINAN|nr:uncharacterized protein LOC112041434 [Lingula anatina]|eukprot:XP_023930409.1 uncharacterized protein LOC112041434 [Lingula anatina]
MATTEPTSMSTTSAEPSTEPTTKHTTEPTTKPITTEGTTTLQSTTQESCPEMIVFRHSYFARGIDLVNVLVASEEACHQLCIGTPLCGIGTFHIRTRGCYLSEHVRMTGREFGWSAFIKSDRCKCEMVEYRDFSFTFDEGNLLGLLRFLKAYNAS